MNYRLLTRKLIDVEYFFISTAMIKKNQQRNNNDAKIILKTYMVYIR